MLRSRARTVEFAGRPSPTPVKVKTELADGPVVKIEQGTIPIIPQSSSVFPGDLILADKKKKISTINNKSRNHLRRASPTFRRHLTPLRRRSVCRTVSASPAPSNTGTNTTSGLRLDTRNIALHNGCSSSRDTLGGALDNDEEGFSIVSHSSTVAAHRERSSNKIVCNMDGWEIEVSFSSYRVTKPSVAVPNIKRALGELGRKIAKQISEKQY